MKIACRILLLGLLAAPLASSSSAEPNRIPAPGDVSFSRVERALLLTPEQAPRAKEIWERLTPPVVAEEARRLNAIRAHNDKIVAAVWAAQLALMPSAQEPRTGGISADPEKNKAARAKMEAVRPELVALQAETSEADSKTAALSAQRSAALSPLLDQRQKSALAAFDDALKQERGALSELAELEAWSRYPGVAEDSARLDAVARARAAAIDPWIRSWKAKDFASFRALLADGYETDSWSDFAQERGGELFRQWTLAGGGQANGEAAPASAKALLDRFASVEAVDLTVLGLRGDDKTPVLDGQISVRGRDAATGRRMEFAAQIKIELAAEGARELIKRTSLTDGTLVRAERDEPLFEDRTRVAGLDAIPSYIRNEAIRRGGYALALGDYDGDGCTDMYVGTEGPGLLMKGDCKGHFKDVTAGSGLADDRLVKAAAFADFNNDGRQDLLLVDFGYSPSKHISLYEGLADGKFRAAKNFDFDGFAGYNYSLPMPMAVGDFDSDGKLDFYVGFPGKLDFSTLAIEAAGGKGNSGHPQGLFMNEGGFKFADKTDYALYSDRGYEARMRTASLFPHSAVAFDIDGDGRQDILVVDDRQNPNPVFRNIGGGKFEQVAEKIGVSFPQWGMSAAVGDFDNDGAPDLYLTNVNFSERNIISDALPQGNRLYHNLGNGTFEDKTPANLRYVGDASGGANFVDFDNDGRLDLLVVNGLWTGARDESLAASFLLAHKSLLPVSNLLTSVHELEFLSSDRDLIEKGRLVMNVLKNVRDPDGTPLYSLGGRQRARLFHNNGDGSFTDVAYVSGLESSADGYVAAVADIYGDGSQDIVLRNADPGTPEHTFPTLQLFKNNAGRGRAHLSLQLAGVKSNRDGIGAQARVTGRDGLKQYRELIANVGAAQDEKALRFGLGSETGVKRLDVRWPSGLTQSFENVDAGDYRLKEGGVLEHVARGSRTAAR